MPGKICATAGLLIGLLQVTQATDWYVAIGGTGVGTSWTDANNNLQGMINKSEEGDTIWVSNGVYNTGGTMNYPSGSRLANRIVITKAITVRSANNDPTNTIIKGAWDSPNTINGPAAVRCVYMSAGSLIGFTITNGATLVNDKPVWSTTHYDVCGGGVMCPNITSPVISNCIITGNSAYGGQGVYYGGGGAWYGTFYNCSFIGNLTYGAPAAGATSGGGARGSVLFNCTLTGNLGKYGGACGKGTVLSNCILTANTAQAGGGAYSSTLYDCTVAGNKANLNYGGGAYCSTLYNCTLTGNSAPKSMSGGGAYDSTMYNCLLTDNTAGFGGGAGSSSASKLYNCTLVGNKAIGNMGGGGAYGGILNNCIICYNTPDNWAPVVKQTIQKSGTVALLPPVITKCCTIPAPRGVGNIDRNPLFVNRQKGDYRLLNDSPCNNCGINYEWMTNSVDARSKDLDGHQRVYNGTVDMGAYEYGGTLENNAVKPAR